MIDNFLVMATDKCYFAADVDLIPGWDIDYIDARVTKRLNSAITFKEYEDAEHFTSIYGGKIKKTKIEDITF
ncbi:hypothetical protein [Mammaliicoccus sp. JADD-157]|uniref:hypothetical protein n=1 Tax=Mammaliicoccus sp. JADD-157 TaxID=3404818 RepID=UPI003BB72941